MKGDKGECSAGDIPNQVRRTKFDTEKNCQAAMHSLMSMGVIPTNYVIYQCKVCKMWHFGKQIWKEKYGI